MNWTVKLVKTADKGKVTLSEITYPSRAKATASFRGMPNTGVFRNDHTQTYEVFVKQTAAK